MFPYCRVDHCREINKFVVHMHILVNIVYSMHSLYLCRYQVFLWIYFHELECFEMNNFFTFSNY